VCLPIPPFQCVHFSLSPVNKIYHLLSKNQVVSVVFNAATMLHPTQHTYNNKERDTTTLAFIPLMLLPLIGWRTHDQTVLYNWREAKYARHDIFIETNWHERNRLSEYVKRCKQIVRRIVNFSCCKFIIENVMGLQRSKQLCSVISD